MGFSITCECPGTKVRERSGGLPVVVPAQAGIQKSLIFLDSGSPPFPDCVAIRARNPMSC
jgi:hypothetical protein